MVWTQESYHKSVQYDGPGECSPKKDCLWWHWLMFQQTKRAQWDDSDDDRTGTGCGAILPIATDHTLSF